MDRSRLTRLLAGVLAAAALGAGCTSDDPEQPLPCEFYEQQVETGAIEIDEVPDEDCRDQIRSGQPPG